MTAWSEHVAKYRLAHPHLTYRIAAKEAKKSYVPLKKRKLQKGGCDCQKGGDAKTEVVEIPEKKATPSNTEIVEKKDSKEESKKEDKKEDVKDGKRADNISIKKVAETAKDIIDAIPAPRRVLPPYVRKYLEQKGDQKITSIQVCRTPILKIIDKALNFISLGLWNKQKKKYGYDDMFHLYILMTLADGTRVRAERNHVIQIATASASDLKAKDCMRAASPGVNLAQFIANGAATEPNGEWFLYDSISNNCQKFVKSLLKSNKISTPSLEKFVVQNVDGLIPKFAQSIGRYITDKAAGVDRALYGDGKRKRRRHKK